MSIEFLAVLVVVLMLVSVLANDDDDWSGMI